jgi:error-prone DNA polymerase
MYCELHCKTNYSFLSGASHPDELVQRAIELGYGALAITDENSLAGVVRAFGAVRAAANRPGWTCGADNNIAQVPTEYKRSLTCGAETGPVPVLVVGAEVVLNDALPVVLWASDRQAYGRLARLLTLGRRRGPKGECWLAFDDLAAHSEGLLAGVIPCLAGDRDRIAHIDPSHPSFPWFAKTIQSRTVISSQAVQSRSPRNTSASPSATAGSQAAQFDHVLASLANDEGLRPYRELFGDRAYLLAELYRGVDDDWRIRELKKLSQQSRIPLLAAGDVLYHCPRRMPLHDVLTAIKHKTTVAQAGQLLLPNAERHLQSVAARQAAFASIPDAIERTMEVVSRCSFCLSQLQYEYPLEHSPPGQTPFEYLRSLTEAGAATRYPQGVPEKVCWQIKHELALIRDLRYEAYFLTVWDLVRFARGRGILCQGRGSAANSAVCYCLGITSVDPDTTDLLFERFISRERNEAPDIDVDFEHERREEVLQYLYEKYGRDRAGLAATVITYRVRSAVRDVGKALGLSLDRVDALAKHVEGYSHDEQLSGRMRDVGIDPESQLGGQLNHLVNEIIGFPRHLSQHVGGMVITRGPLDELVPVENAAMDGRTVIQWDKDDLEELGLLKVDCLCLGMLTAIRKCFQLLQKHWSRHLTLATVPREDPLVYDMICQADTVGVFQIESRGQMSMLPRLKPRCWYDLVIEVAIVRPGPIQGNMVHPYLRRRNGEEVVDYPNEEIKAVLHRTLGVPIFQEQAMKLAVVAAGFTPGEADQLRRAMGAWRKTGVIEKFRQKLMDGMRQKGLHDEFAEQVFRQIRGFGEYGFPESHAASFALLVYVSAWLKRYYPAAFTASIINSQPMGFYAPAQLIACAQRHGVIVLPIDVNHSDWDCTLESAAGDRCGGNLPTSDSKKISLRLGLRMISGLPAADAERILAARQQGPYASIADFARRTNLGSAAIARLSRADAFQSVQQDRRAALWQALAQEDRPVEQPLFDKLLAVDDATNQLPDMPLDQQVVEDYRAVGLSLKAHPISFHRDQLDAWQVVPSNQLENKRHNQYVRVAGLVILRQRPSTAKGITFVTLEDETGTANLVVKQQTWERFYSIARRSPAWIASGKLEKKQGVIHVVVSKLEDLSQRLNELGVRSRDFR